LRPTLCDFFAEIAEEALYFVPAAALVVGLGDCYSTKGFVTSTGGWIPVVVSRLEVEYSGYYKLWLVCIGARYSVIS